jgi:phytoene synthase
MDLYNKLSFSTNKLITKTYSTSFSMASSMFDKETREAIFNIYGFVRIADEIVDTFHNYDKKYLLEKFEQDYYDAIRQGISFNPVLNAFQFTVKKYGIPDEHIKAFLNSMKCDLNIQSYNNESEISEYIYGSADVVGLMCLKVFCNGNTELYKKLETPAMKLGSAFQKVNFLRDINNDIHILGRQYFPLLNNKELDNDVKVTLINDIENDFNIAYVGIKMLPGRSKLAVLIAFYYYKGLLNKIKKTTPNVILNNRIRISDTLKIILLLKALFVYKLKLI